MPRSTELGLALALVLAGACGGGGGSTDAGPPAFPDAALYPVGCEHSFGRTFVLSHFAVVPPGEGLDINGDGVPDNALGFLGPVVNPPWAEAIVNGTATYVIDISRWDLTPDDPDMDVASFLAFDADDPPDHSNDLGGDGEFYVATDQYDVNCRPLSFSEGTSIEDGLIHVEEEEWRFFAPYIGTIQFYGVRMELQLDAELDEFQGLMAAGWSVCSMSRTFIPQLGTASFLDLVVNQGAGHPDVEADGDGQEQIFGDGAYVTSCVDGDGTVIEGRDCACDPRMADRYSMSVESFGVPATVLGTLEP